jgi:hypothetical protein
MGYSWILVVLFVIGFILFRVYRRGTELRRLTEHGVGASGEVLYVQRFPAVVSGTRFLRYQFKTPDGEVYARKIALSAAKAERYRRGGAIEIVYLPQNPKVSTASDLVEFVRQGLAKRR